MAVNHPGLRAALRLSPAARTSARLVRSFAERETKALYKRNVLGWLWSLLKPLTTVAVYSLVFGVIYRATAPVTANGRAEAFALYLFSGLVVWNVFHTIVNGSMRWMDGVSELRKKIYFPTETAIIGGAVATLLQSSMEALVLVLIMAALVNVSWTLVFLPVAMVLAAMFALGLGFAASILNARYRDIQHLSTIVRERRVLHGADRLHTRHCSREGLRTAHRANRGAESPQRDRGRGPGRGLLPGGARPAGAGHGPSRGPSCRSSRVWPISGAAPWR